MQDYIRLQSGRKLRYHKLRTQDIHIEDIAHNLSHLCRFTGASRKFYSVAEHVCHCADSAPPEHKLGALLHDASEAYASDLNTILKHILPQYQIIEQKLEKIIAKKFKIPFPHNPTVKEIDTRMLKTEMTQLLPGNDAAGIPFSTLEIKLKCWTPKLAKKEFLKRYYKLTNAAR